MVLSLVLMNFVNGNGGVNNRWLDGLFLNDGLNVLVNVMVDVLTRQSWCSCASVLSFSDCAGVLELSCLGGKAVLDMRVVAVLNLAMLNFTELV